MCELPLILRVDRKRKKRAGDICKGTLDIEFELDWSVGLDATLRERQKIKNFSRYKDFSGKSDSAILLGYECTINPQNLMKIVGDIFEKMKIFIFFLCELPLILRVDRKRSKRAGDICKETQDFECERDWSVGLGPTLGD